MKSRPVIKGIFVNSHLRMLEKEFGASAVSNLSAKLGHEFPFDPLGDVPIFLEVQILEHLVHLKYPDLDAALIPQRAGSLHFENFLSTPYGRMMNKVLRKDFPTVLIRLSYVFKHIFRGVTLRSEYVTDRHIQIIIQHADYCIDHFKGLLTSWASAWEFKCWVNAIEGEFGQHIYDVKW